MPERRARWMPHAVLLITLFCTGLSITLLPAYAAPLASPEPTAILANSPVTVAPPVVVRPSAPNEPDVSLRSGRIEPTPPAPGATPAAGFRPDRCEPHNDVPERACSLPLDAVSGPFSFVPEGDVDYYAFDLGATPTNLPVVITVRGTAGLELVTTITRADSGEALGLIEHPASAATLAADLTGWVILRVETRAPASGLGETYRIEVRRVLPPPPAPERAPGDEPRARPDALENNWSPDTAAPIAIGSLYDLTLVCPEEWPDACPGGDHDYLLVPVKRATRYLLATFDLAPGVDTVLDLFWYDATGTLVPVDGNDDYRPGRGLLSALWWQAPDDGALIVRVGPRHGATEARLPETKEPPPLRSYRFAVALAESDLARQLVERLDAQTGWVPTPTARPATAPRDTTPPQPTPTPPGAAAAANDSEEAEAAGSDAARAPNRTKTREGAAYIVVETAALRVRPDPEAEVLQVLAGDTVVQLTGTAAGGWVEVETADGVLPGWLRAHDLRRVLATVGADPQAGSGQTGDTGAAGHRPEPTQGGSSPGMRVTPLDPPAPPALPAPLQRVPLSVTVRVVQGDPSAATGNPQKATGLPPLEGIRVQLVSVFGDVLTDARTDSGGEVRLAVTVLPGTAVRVRLPGVGLSAPVDSRVPTLTMVIPAPISQAGGQR